MTSAHHSILDNLLTAIVVLNRELHIIYMNAAAEDLLGMSGDHIVGKALESYFHPSDTTSQAISAALKLDSNYTKRRANWKLHHGKEIVVDYSVTPDIENKHITIEIHPLDRLLRISREEAWMASQETTTNMVRSMAHEIKNPLGGIRGAAQLLARELHDQEDLEEFTKIIIGETDRLRTLTDRMLGPTKPIRHRPVNVHEVIEHVVSIIMLEAQGSIELHKDYDPSIPDLLADKEQLIQALMNIGRNAYQALTEHNVAEPSILVRTRVKRRYTIGRKSYPLVAHITISDNGPGIPAHLIEDIFFPMITGRAEGTGLGLAITQNLITRHEGLVEVASVPGNTEFAIYLPLGSSNA